MVTAVFVEGGVCQSTVDEAWRRAWSCGGCTFLEEWLSLGVAPKEMTELEIRGRRFPRTVSQRGNRVRLMPCADCGVFAAVEGNVLFSHAKSVLEAAACPSVKRQVISWQRAASRAWWR